MEVNGIVEEVEALKSIYFRELEVINDASTNVPTRISINLHPATADNAQEQYVCLTLVINLPQNYPNELPEILIRNPRGLADEDFERIKTDLLAKASESHGNAMLYELIEIAKEHLTKGNTPRCACAICLYGFTDADVFTKTGCYHYFHSHCLARYVGYVIDSPISANPLTAQTSEEDVKVLCPVCREPIDYDLETLKAPPPLQSEGAAPFELNSELVKLQEQMSQLFDKQKSQGGIIDVEAEKNKYLLEISSVPTEVDHGQPDAAARTDAKLANHKASKKETQRSSRKPPSQDRDDQQQQERRPPRDARRNQASDWQNYNFNSNYRGRGGRPYRTNGSGYSNRSNRGRRGGDRNTMTASQHYADSDPNSMDDAAAPPQQHKSMNNQHSGPQNHTANGWRPPYGQQGRGRGRGRGVHQQQPRRKPAAPADVNVVENGKAAALTTDSDVAENGKSPAPQTPRTKKMDWAEQVGEEESPPPRTDAPPQRRGYGHMNRAREDAAAQESRDSYRKRGGNYRSYRRWNPALDAAKVEPPSAEFPGTKTGKRAACPVKASGAESIPVSRFVVLTGPPTMAFSDSTATPVAFNGADAADRRRRLPPGFSQSQDVPKTIAAGLPPGFKSRPEAGFEAKM